MKLWIDEGSYIVIETGIGHIGVNKRTCDVRLDRCVH